jgi:hypothetical protein
MKDGTQKVALGQGGAQQHPDLHEPSRDEYSGFSDDSESESVRRKRGCLGYAPILVLTFLTAGLLRGISWKKRS